jgi:hypothetical protein
MSKYAVVFVKDPLGSEGFLPQDCKLSLRMLAWVFSANLDRQLAAGASPESTRLLASRADKLVAPSTRTSLARNWRSVLEQARRPPRGHARRVPLCDDRILANAADVLAMTRALEASRPSTARGVAMASRLLSDGTGPLYNPHSTTDLRAALLEVTMQLNAGNLIESF